MLESELSFLIKELPEDLENHKKSEIEQGYFSNSASPLRLRKKDESFILTKKTPITAGDFSRYEEIEMSIDQEEFNLLWPVCVKKLSKTRYFYPLTNGLTAEIDIYHGPLEGLATVEVEFPDEGKRTNFKIPDWFGQDITQEEWSANAALANLSYADVLKMI